MPKRAIATEYRGSPIALDVKQQLRQAKLALGNIWNRWNREPDEAERKRLWKLVAEAEKRLFQAKQNAGVVTEGICPGCQKTAKLFVFKDEEGETGSVCKKCGWSNREDLLDVIRDTARRIRTC